MLFYRNMWVWKGFFFVVSKWRFFEGFLEGFLDIKKYEKIYFFRVFIFILCM